MMHLIVLLALAGSASILPASPSHTNARVARAATVQGRITTQPTPAKRVANRYVGAASPVRQQTLPVIVYLRGAGLPAASLAAKPLVMTQHDTAFSPAFLIVPRGSSVGFQNMDPFYHNVFSYSKAKRFDLGRFPKPESKSIVFDKVGAIDVFCEIHSSMRAVVLVTDNDFHTELAPDGSYSLQGVPAGRYELVVWHADRGQKVVPITVPSSGVLTVNSSI